MQALVQNLHLHKTFTQITYFINRYFMFNGNAALVNIIDNNFSL